MSKRSKHQQKRAAKPVKKNIAVRNLAGYKVGFVAVDGLDSLYRCEPVDVESLSLVGPALICKANESRKVLAPPFSMKKLLDLLDFDEYHAGCVDAIEKGTVMRFSCKNSQVDAWLKAAEFPAGEDAVSVLGGLITHYAACGNGFLLKLRDAQGQWKGLERLLPNEMQIVENYDEFGFFKPDYVQVRDGKRREFSGTDVIHFKRFTHRSRAWGLACLPVALNMEIMAEIKRFDFNTFKNGLLIDYIVIVEGGTLREKEDEVTNEQGEVVVTSVSERLESALREARGNNKSHGLILLESEDPNVRIRLEPLRQQEREGAFLALKKDLREGLFAYHRVPARIVSQLIPGQLGGDNRTDMLMFHHFVVKPLQHRLAYILAREFNQECGYSVVPDDFDFGDLAEVYLSEDEKSLINNKTF